MIANLYTAEPGTTLIAAAATVPYCERRSVASIAAPVYRRKVAVALSAMITILR